MDHFKSIYIYYIHISQSVLYFHPGFLNYIFTMTHYVFINSFIFVFFWVINNTCVIPNQLINDYTGKEIKGFQSHIHMFMFATHLIQAQVYQLLCKEQFVSQMFHNQ